VNFVHHYHHHQQQQQSAAVVPTMHELLSLKFGKKKNPKIILLTRIFP
jgi:hypothetical protein